jgi:hypothetical protein
MRLFDKLRRSTGGTGTDASDPVSGRSVAVDDREADGPGAVDQPPIAGPAPSPASAGAMTTAPPIPDPGGYDPTHPCHAPVSGVDLVLFAQVTHRLRVAPAEERTALLADHGHTPETWSAVNTVWMARLGRMPYLCATYDEAARLP